MTNDLPHGEAAAATSSQVRPQNLDRGGNTRPGSFSRLLNIEDRATRRLRDEERVHAILIRVAAQYGVGIHEILGDRRHKYIVKARHEVVRRVYNETQLSKKRIATILGYKDHCTILYVINERRRKLVMARNRAAHKKMEPKPVKVVKIPEPKLIKAVGER